MHTDIQNYNLDPTEIQFIPSHVSRPESGEAAWFIARTAGRWTR